MARDRNLDHLTTLLGQCLGRIDERAYQLQQLADDDSDLDPHDVLEGEAATLQELIGGVIENCAPTEHADVARIVTRAISACLQELGTPVVVKQQLAAGLPLVACNPGQLTFAVQRALVIAAGRLEVGGELVVTTRADGESVVLEIESRGGSRDRHLQERAETLCEFVAAFHGNCRVELPESGHVLVAIDLPTASAIDD